MKREAEPILRPEKRHEAANMDDALAAMERSGSIYFLKRALPRTSIPALSTKTSVLGVPAQFVRKHADKVEGWVILRVQSSNGRSSRPWAVQLIVNMLPVASFSVQFVSGWKDFAAGNGLRMGDSLIFLLKEDARSEFEVQIFRGPEAPYFPYFPDESNSSSSSDDDGDKEEKYISSSEEEEGFAEDSDDDEKQCRVRTRVHHGDARNRASTGYGRDGKVATGQQTKHSRNDKVFPGFRKVMSVTNIQRSVSSVPGSGQFELLRHFVKTHGKHLQTNVQLQGVRGDSPVYVIPCTQFARADDGQLKICFKSREWNIFVKANCLKIGQELQFSLIADSYFKVRII